MGGVQRDSKGNKVRKGTFNEHTNIRTQIYIHTYAQRKAQESHTQGGVPRDGGRHIMSVMIQSPCRDSQSDNPSRDGRRSDETHPGKWVCEEGGDREQRKRDYALSLGWVLAVPHA